MGDNCMYQYYVQVIANNYLKNLVDEPSSMDVHKAFLHGLEEDEFQSGYCELLSTVRMMYSDIAADPKEFDMLLRQNTVPNVKNVDYTQSHASFLRVPNLLFIIGCHGELQPDLSLVIAGNKLMGGAKELKITKVPTLLKKLIDYGFETEGMSKTIQADDMISVGFPQNRFLLPVLKSMSEAMAAINKNDLRKTKDYFYMMDHRILENEIPKAPKLTIDYLYHVLDDDKRRVAKALNDFIAKYAKPAVRMGGFSRNDWSCVYTLQANKKVIMSLGIEQENLSVKLNLANISRYADSLKQFPDEITETIKTSGWDCGHCHDSCAGPFSFTYEGKAYNKCRCGSFIFDHIDKDTVHYCIELLEKEIQA
jgi:hypothetical protein